MRFDEEQFSIELCDDAGFDIERVLARESRLDAARVLYELMIAQHPGRLVILCDGAMIIARSDEPERT